MNLRVENVRNSKRKQEIEDLYVSSFPKEDRMHFVMMIMMSYMWNTEFLAFYDDDVLFGFVYMASNGKLKTVTWCRNSVSYGQMKKSMHF